MQIIYRWKLNFSTLALCIPARFDVIPSTMLAATFTDIDHLVGLCLQAEGNQFQHLP
jgi:hypothetical protein